MVGFLLPLILIIAIISSFAINITVVIITSIFSIFDYINSGYSKTQNKSS